MANIFIIHGVGGNPGENWFPWLKSKLEKLGCRVFVPKFPTPKNQTLENWLKIFGSYKQYLDKNSIVVGHSLGSAFLLNILEKLNKPIKTAFLVAGFTGLLENPNFDRINKSFIDKSFDWQKIKQNCPKFFVFHSDNDPYVPLKKSKDLAKNLGVDVILVKNAGHFNEKAGYAKFDLILEKIKTVL
jgi:predicted alpha/beta hydrolase family esterase